MDTRRFLTVNEIGIDNFFCSAPNIIHCPYPRHLVDCFKLFRYTLTLCHLLYQPRKHFLCLLINISKITVQLARCKQISVKDTLMLFDISQMALSPNADRLAFFFGECQARQIIIALLFVPKTVLYIINSVFHYVILQI